MPIIKVDNFDNKQENVNKENISKFNNHKCLSSLNIIKEISSLSVFEPTDFPFFLFNKQIDFFLTNDLIKCILYSYKENSQEYLLQLMTYKNTRKGLEEDIYFIDFKLRSNFSNLITKKKINFPLILNGNVYFPNLCFFRSHSSKLYSKLELPITSPFILTQLAHKGIFDDPVAIEKINHQVIKEALETSEKLNYQNLIVNLINFESDAEIFEVIKCYINCLVCEELFFVKNIVFAMSYTYEGFLNFMHFHDINNILTNYKIKSRLFVE
jgi:hypothetical protein